VVSDDLVPALEGSEAMTGPIVRRLVLSLWLVPTLALATPPAGKPARARGVSADSTAVVAMLAGVPNGACPVRGIATGGQPRAEHFAAVKRAGFNTVLDLRMPGEDRGLDETAALKAAGLEYVRIPMTRAITDAQFDSVRAELRRRDGQGVFVHCASGARVNATLVPWLVLDRGWELERAVALARNGGLHAPELEALARDYVARQRKGR
jgi:protein tyrosine phosphatase (PTP) superfamily phosphohydrolase (DUF442 family)